MFAPTHRLLTFGGLSLVRTDGESGALVGQRKRLALLAILAASNGQGMSRDRLLALLWPEADVTRARNALKQFVYTIRRVLGDDALIDVNGSLALNPALIQCDVQEFRAALASGALSDAASLYQGPFLDGVYLRDVLEFEHWLEDMRTSLAHEYTGALERLVALAESGDRTAAVRWARTLAAADPHSTRSALTLIRALEASGDRAAAIRAGEVHAELLRTDLGVDVTAEVRDALRRLRQPIAEDTRNRAPPIEPARVVSPSIESSSRTDQPRERTHRNRRRPIVVAATIITLFVGGGAVILAARSPRPARVVGLTQITIGQTAEMEPAVSPDGKWIAFASTRRGEATTRFKNMRVYVQSITGGPARPLIDDSTTGQQQPAWSPDGLRIAFRTPTGIFLVSAVGGTPTQILAYDAQRPVELGGWSHDGTRIAYADTQGVWIRDLNAGTTTLVTRTGFSPHSPTWSPDDSTIAYVVGTGSIINIAPSAIWLVRVRGGTPERLTDALHFNTSPVFASDGRSLFFVSNRDGVRDVYELSLPTRDGRPPARLTTGANAQSISLSADGRSIVYAAEIMRSNLWSAPILPNAVTPITAARQLTFGDQEVECISTSPDGHWVLYDSNKNGNSDIYKLSTNGGDPIQLTTDPADDFCGRMSADSREVAFYSFRRGGVRRVFTMSSDGTRQRILFDESPAENQWSPAWNPDGTRLAFATPYSGFRQINIVTHAAPNAWTDRRVIRDFRVGGIAWTPDGTRLTACADSGIVTIAPDGGDQRLLLSRSRAGNQENCFFAWGRGTNAPTLYYRTTGARGETGFWAVTPDGRQRLVFNLADSTHTSRRGEFAVDEARLYFTLSSDDATIWKIELARR